MIMICLYAVASMVCRSERVLGSSSRPRKSNKDDPIVMDDAKVKYIGCFVHR